MVLVLAEDVEAIDSLMGEVVKYLTPLVIEPISGAEFIDRHFALDSR
jgi:hypothetical protein